MQTTTTIPVAIIQELIAIHTTRKEAAERLESNQQPGNTQTAPIQQSEAFITQLMNELSGYGDAVRESVERENAYQVKWKSTLGNIDSLSSEEKTQTFHALEESLKRFYEDILKEQADLPESIKEMLQKQQSSI